MSVYFSHKLIINESRVLEALTLMHSLINNKCEQSSIDLSPFQDISMKYEDLIKSFSNIKPWSFSSLEFAIIVDERDDIDTFFSAVKKLDRESQLLYLFASQISIEEAQDAITNKTAIKNLLIRFNIDVSFLDVIWDLDHLINRYHNMAKDINEHPEFIKTMDLLYDSNGYSEALAKMRDGMTYRHPLSYAQEIMGKPFWNISDYKSYEFVPIYFVSPTRMRITNSDKMIYINPLITNLFDKSDKENSLAAQLKVIADPTRLKILRKIYMRPMYGKEIADEFGLTTATISHHLELLNKQGLLNLEQDKQIKYFSTNISKLKSISDDLLEFVKNYKE